MTLSRKHLLHLFMERLGLILHNQTERDNSGRLAQAFPKSVS